ncbi:4-hydroxy-tetrahydrodipicolinate synthase [Alphaproteobacteria bacterium HT1-32]|nr:4-hydroxy-tetrahydrodipicolinate synthase [Alphaproteobacteria bacterium HT1-32]|tara:strand:- start:11343 stop:12284 length:942 start_codon:yes stop_codon:yes gene_type:complete
MTKQLITGSFVALITPFNEDGSVDFAGFRDLLQFQEQNGTSAVLIMGSTGEVSMLTPDERHAIVRETMKMRTGKMQFWYGCTGTTTEGTIAYVKQAAAEGADGAIIAAPAYICASNEDIVQYALEVADASPIAIGYYNNPPRVKTDLTAADLIRLSEHPNIVVNKESTTRVGQIAQLCAAKPDMSLMCCCSPNLGLVVPLMALGGHGTANMTGNLIPQELAVISTPWKNGDDAFACREAWLHNLPMLHFAYSAINPVAVKSLMRAVGLPAGPLRKPLRELDPAHLQRGLDIVRDLELDKKYGYKLPTLAVAAE